MFRNECLFVCGNVYVVVKVVLDLHDPLQESNLHLNVVQLDNSPSVHGVPYSDVLQLGYG